MTVRDLIRQAVLGNPRNGTGGPLCVPQGYEKLQSRIELK